MDRRNIQELIKGLKGDANTYLAILIQAGQGCDYTIGCGMTVSFLNVPDPSQLQQKIRKLLEYYGTAQEVEDGVYKITQKPNDRAIDYVLIVKASEVSDIDVNQLRAMDSPYWEQKARDEELAKDRAELERLQAKLGTH